ncbi:hypothetical protein U6A24_06550 [Aquimarina gracilis]|uniref:ABM domain-containing protein n=1 Tax=Aquimarina gracilis TaxID=874422 RepID=A0ABU5ZSP8_9FLAO|nr:hypothetical protein [Aquimarina gracilis]MEB3345110.1 hypothetical protein [Aquimarina gracilis]
MQILVIWKVKPEVDMNEVMKHMVAEEHFAWKEYMEGNLRQFWLTEKPGFVVMILEYDSIEEAKAANTDLPLLKAGLMEAEFHELKPFQSWEFLFKDEHKMVNRE